jgi:ATP synthase in type III secretion protein N
LNERPRHGRFNLDSQLFDATTKLAAEVTGSNLLVVTGRVADVKGPVVRANMKSAFVGEICELIEVGKGKIGSAEVIGLEGGLAVLAPTGATHGLSNRSEVIATKEFAKIRINPAILGSVVDPEGRCMQRLVPSALTTGQPESRVLSAQAPSPFERTPIRDVISTGLRAIDGLITIGRGQRIGIFGAPSSGKSSLISQITTQAQVDVVVVGLIGERGREVSEFVDRISNVDMTSRTVVVACTSDRPPVERLRGALSTMTIAEYFRDQGLNVLLVMDSVTRFARAQREIGLAAGELPTRRGFPPSVFEALPRLFERSGNAAKGSITAIYTILSEGDISNDPIAEEVLSLLDGHIILSSDMAAVGEFPAIDILASRSRLMEAVCGHSHVAAAQRFRSLMAKYRDIELLIRVGEYKKGNDRESDEAVAKHAGFMGFLRQATTANHSLRSTIQELERVVRA